MKNDEVAWLIEVNLRGRPHYWKASADTRCIGEFDPDANAALRLSREKDARDLALFLRAKGAIALSDVCEIKITEHMWPRAAHEPPAPPIIGFDLTKPGTERTVYACPHGNSFTPCPHCWEPKLPELPNRSVTPPVDNDHVAEGCEKFGDSND